MKKMIASLLVLGTVLVGCSGPRSQATAPTQVSQIQETVTVPTVAQEPLLPELPMYAVALEPVTEVLRAEDGAELFRCSYPEISVVLDGCEAEKTVAEDVERRMGELLKEAGAIRNSAQLDYAGQEGWTAYHAKADFELGRLDRAARASSGCTRS